MTPHQTLTVAVRLFAVWLALIVLREVVGGLMSSRMPEYDSLLPVIIVVGVVGFLLVVALWFFPRSIARGLLPSGADAPSEPSSPEVWFAIGTSLIGLWLIASSVPGILRNLIVLYLFRTESMDKSGLESGLIYVFAEAAVGALLIVGTNGIRRFVWWARHAGPD
jgi:hypothetical protein